jgi:hypothetical protein
MPRSQARRLTLSCSDTSDTENEETSRLSVPGQTPFDSVENAQQYVRLLLDAIIEAKQEIDADLAATNGARLERRLQALQLVQFKLTKLEHHLQNSGRLLNDLRTLRRLLLDERAEPAASIPDGSPTG